jgi:hypothetical protein
MGIDT